jgi:hypothetical protein
LADQLAAFGVTRRPVGDGLDVGLKLITTLKDVAPTLRRRYIQFGQN